MVHGRESLPDIIVWTGLELNRDDHYSPMKFRDQTFGILLFLLALCAPVLRAQDGLPGVLSRSTRAARSVPDFGPQIVAADFDNDQKPDGAILLETGLLDGKRSFRIELHVTADKNNAITFLSTESGLGISALDVNQDGAPDIVVEKILTHERLQVYLNDGHGAFHKARIEDYPSPDPAAPGWKARLAENLPVFCLPSTQGFETAGLQRIRMLGPNTCGRLNFWPESLVAQSGARAPSASRAPPTVRSL